MLRVTIAYFISDTAIIIVVIVVAGYYFSNCTMISQPYMSILLLG